MSPNILCLGDLLIDVVVRYDPASGEADTGPDAVRILPGGSAANFAVHAARLGANVRFISRVGRDLEGQLLMRSLAHEGVTACVRAVDEAPTGRVLVMVDRSGHRRMWSYPGASRTISPHDLRPEWFEALHAFHLTGYSLLRDGPREAAVQALALARARGTQSIQSTQGVYKAPLCTLDPNPGHLIADFGPGRFRELLASLRFDVLFPNLEEGRLLTGRERPEEIATHLLALSPTVVLTLGDRGCMVASGGELFSVPAVETQVMDATGAGDAFAAGFVIEYLRSGDLRQAAHTANRVAAQVVTRIGAR
jgi:sugar/nucleoside kinase (ribokinase family)